MSDPVPIKLRGVKYHVKFVKHIPRRKGDKKRDEYLGDCDCPKTENPVIRLCVNKLTTEKAMCEIMIHEFLHGCVWELSEATIAETARSIQKSIYKLGFKLVRKTKNKKASH